MRTQTKCSFAGLAREFEFDFLSDRADVAGEARRNGWNLEDAARRLRYQFFNSVAVSHGLDRVAVAHTANDQAETLLAHLFRGTGPAGLAGIYPVAGRIIRPLLDIERNELRDYLLSLNQSWREDASNHDTTRTRARIRHKLFHFFSRNSIPRPSHTWRVWPAMRARRKSSGTRWRMSDLPRWLRSSPRGRSRSVSPICYPRFRFSRQAAVMLIGAGDLLPRPCWH